MGIQGLREAGLHLHLSQAVFVTLLGRLTRNLPVLVGGAGGALHRVEGLVLRAEDLVKGLRTLGPQTLKGR
jgi:hypothetical protein